MRTNLARLVPVLIAASCGSPQRVERSDPKSYTERMAEADAHEREARVHEKAAREGSGPFDPAKVRCGNPVVGQVADQSTSGGERVSTWVPCWSVERDAAIDHKAKAAELRRQAAKDRAVARNLVEVEREFCRGLPADELTHTPFYHREDIAVVQPYREGGTLMGARIRFKPVEGLTDDWMRQAIQCHRARAATLGHDPKYMDYDPTLVGDLDVAVTESRGTVEVLVRSRDDVNAAVVLSRAEALLTRPVAAPPAGPAVSTH